MLVEQVELTLSHVDLDGLSEFAAMTLFGVAHAHRLTLGTGHSIRDITDQAGAPLYPGYYWTHLTVPPTNLLRRHRVWSTIAVGVDVQSFGGALLTSSYVLGRPDEVDETTAAEAGFATLPSMRAGSMFYLDGGEGDPKPAAPKRGCLASLPALTAAPAALQRFRDARDQPSLDPDFAGRLVSAAPLSFALGAGREVHGPHGIMFARYVIIADSLERQLLCQQLWPPFPVALVDCLAVLERETFYFANVRGERVLRGKIRALVQKCPADLHGADQELVSAGILTSIIELYDDANVLIMTSRSKKLLAVPSAQQRLVAQAARVVAAHGQ